MELKRGQLWRHRKTGGVYKIRQLARLQDSDQALDMVDMVVYEKNEPDSSPSWVWVRRKSEFEDGRFEPVLLEEPDFGERLLRISGEVTLPPNYRILVRQDGAEGRWFLQLEVDRPDTFTECPGTGRGGKAYLSPHATDSELVQTLFGLFKAYLEHEAREAFRWRGRRIFGPHLEIEALWGVAESYALREPPKSR